MGKTVHKCPFWDNGYSVENCQWQIRRKVGTGGINKMKTLLIVAAIIVFLVHGFVMYCCIKVGAESEKNYDELAKGVRKEKGSKKTLETM